MLNYLKRRYYLSIYEFFAILGQNLHIECRIEPYPDATLNVEWYLNDKPLPFGNRWRTSYDFGFAALDIIGAYAEDSGRYTLKAKNALGQAESHIEVKIQRKYQFRKSNT